MFWESGNLHLLLQKVKEATNLESVNFVRTGVASTMARRPTYYSPDYLEQALRLIVEIGRPPEFVSRKLNIPQEILDALVDRYQNNLDQSVNKQELTVAQEFVAKTDLVNIERR